MPKEKKTSFETMTVEKQDITVPVKFSATGMVNATTGTIACKATFPNPDGKLFSGIQGTVVMPSAKQGVTEEYKERALAFIDKSPDADTCLPEDALQQLPKVIG
jgi:hypothetical protein